MTAIQNAASTTYVARRPGRDATRSLDGLSIKRIYEPVSDADGFRVVVDRLWATPIDWLDPAGGWTFSATTSEFRTARR